MNFKSFLFHLKSDPSAKKKIIVSQFSLTELNSLRLRRKKNEIFNILIIWIFLDLKLKWIFIAFCEQALFFYTIYTRRRLFALSLEIKKKPIK